MSSPETRPPDYCPHGLGDASCSNRDACARKWRADQRSNTPLAGAICKCPLNCQCGHQRPEPASGVDVDAAIEAALRIIAAAFGRTDKRPRFCIPARPDDDDSLVMDALRELQRLRSGEANKDCIDCDCHYIEFGQRDGCPKHRRERANLCCSTEVFSHFESCELIAEVKTLRKVADVARKLEEKMVDYWVPFGDDERGTWDAPNNNVELLRRALDELAALSSSKGEP